jgi:hypothetical protein
MPDVEFAVSREATVMVDREAYDQCRRDGSAIVRLAPPEAYEASEPPEPWFWANLFQHNMVAVRARAGDRAAIAIVNGSRLDGEVDVIGFVEDGLREVLGVPRPPEGAEKRQPRARILLDLGLESVEPASANAGLTNALSVWGRERVPELKAWLASKGYDAEVHSQAGDYER